MRSALAVRAAAAAVFAGPSIHEAAAQPAPLEQLTAAVHVDSGFVVNLRDEPATVYTTIVQVPDATWIRLQFDQALLGGVPEGSATLRITSLADGAVQNLNAATVRQWRNTSAYFNGDAISVELIAPPDAERRRVVIREVLYGPEGLGGVGTICDGGDDRLPSSDPRVARTSPGGCTAWLISDCCNCFLTAGHCAGSAGVMQFNVPLSNSDGSWNHPGPEDQYAVDSQSMQSLSGVGNDWAYFGCFANTETGLTAFEAQGMAFDLAAPPPVNGQTIRVTGHGTDNTPLMWNQIQQTATGPYWQLSGSTVRYRVDTMGGNSGSPVINEETGEAIGIHTHGGCGQAPTSSNAGTATTNGGLQTALANPQGVCNQISTTLPLFDDIPNFDLDPTLWTSIVGAHGSTRGINEPSPLRSMNLDAGPAGAELARTALMDTSAGAPKVTYWYQQKGNDDQPEAGDDLVVEFLDGSDDWIEVHRHFGGGPAMSEYEFVSLQLPGEAQHAGFRLRFRSISDEMGDKDDHFVDDICIGSGADCPDLKTPCPFDCDDSGFVDSADFLAFLANFGGGGGFGCSDGNQDGTVDSADFLGLLAAFGPCP